MNIIFENSSPKGSFGANKKKVEFLLLSPDSWKLQTTSLNLFSLLPLSDLFFVFKIWLTCWEVSRDFSIRFSYVLRYSVFFCFNVRERLLDRLGACKFLSITEFWSDKQGIHKWWLTPEIRSHTTLRISRLHERVTTKTHFDWFALLSAPAVVTVASKKFTKESWQRLMAFLSLFVVEA